MKNMKTTNCKLGCTNEKCFPQTTYTSNICMHDCHEPDWEPPILTAKYNKKTTGNILKLNEILDKNCKEQFIKSYGGSWWWGVKIEKDGTVKPANLLTRIWFIIKRI